MEQEKSPYVNNFINLIILLTKGGTNENRKV